MVKLRQLVLATGVVMTGLACGSASATTLDRYYNDNGLMFRIDGSIRPTLSKRINKFSYLYGDPRAFDAPRLNNGGVLVGFDYGTLAQVLNAQNEARTDERLRMSGVNDSYLNFGINQSLTSKSGLYTSLGAYHTPSSGALITGDAVFYNIDYGEIILSGNAGLPTMEAGTSGTYNVLDTRAGGAVIAGYRYIPKLTLQGYYRFADLPDGNPLATGMQKGYGAIASYAHSFAPRNNLTVHLGYTDSERRKNLSLNAIPRTKTGAMAGLDYRYYNWSLGLDGGVSKSKYHGNVLNKSETTATGVRVGYAFTPRFSTFAFYGKQDTKATEAEGVRLTFNRLLNTGFMEGRMPVINETQLFKTIKEDTYGVGVRYNYHSNVSFNGNISESNTKYSLVDGDFAKLKSQNYSVGVSLSF